MLLQGMLLLEQFDMSITSRARRHSWVFDVSGNGPSISDSSAVESRGRASRRRLDAIWVDELVAVRMMKLPEPVTQRLQQKSNLPPDCL